MADLQGEAAYGVIDMRRRGCQPAFAGCNLGSQYRYRKGLFGI
jgi:hypothetical protein